MRCSICHHSCELGADRTTVCGTKGDNQSFNDGQILAIALDPIEKKPLRQFYPGTTILSIGTFGCNLKCPWCQNCELIVQSPMSQPSDLNQLAGQLLNRATSSGAMGIAFTYNEPLLWHRTVLEVSKTFKSAGLKTVMVSNGCANLPIINQLLPWIDAWNVDLKTVNPEAYKTIFGHLPSVMNTLRAILAHGSHLEVTYLIVPKFNDSQEDLIQLANLVFELGVPVLHLSRYFPANHYVEPPTSEEIMRLAEELVSGELRRLWEQNPDKRLTAVYLGNCSWVHDY